MALFLPSKRWRFSLRAMFLAMTVCGLLMMVSIQLGPKVIAGAAPFSENEALCVECGMERDVATFCGQVTKDEIRSTEASDWARGLVPADHRHRWVVFTSRHRSHWFGGASIGCGGPTEGAMLAWQLARSGHQEAAEKLYREYQDILTGKSAKSMAIHRQELMDAVVTAGRKQ